MARLVLVVGGSVAAYKAVDLASKAVQAGHEVDVVMTRMALRFVGALSFAAITHRPVFTDERWVEGRGAAEHLAATDGADLLVVAPATADLLAKMAHGLADEVASATYLGAPCPTLAAPAMNARMWRHPRTVANVAVLQADGVRLVGPDDGWLAERETGPGRMADPAAILRAVGEALG